MAFGTGKNLQPYLMRGSGRPFTSGSGSDTIDKAELGEYGDKIVHMLNDMKKSELLKLAVLKFYVQTIDMVKAKPGA